jgi:Kef-type K+ transport system membrane component KefB
MIMAFLYALVAELTGLSCIIGASIAVISCSSIQLIHSNEFLKGTEYFRSIFAAIFFVSLGVIADFRTLTLPRVWFLFILCIAAIITRVVSCGIPAKFFGISGKDSLIIGFGIVPRGEFAMIVAFIGSQQGIIEHGIYLILVIMSIMRVLFTPLVYRNRLFRKETDNPLCQHRRIESWNPAGFSY